MPFRILSLDGGGAWALIQARTLIRLYGAEAKGREVLRNFDLAAANSGGSLVLAGLVEDLALADILEYFMDEQKRRSIFSPTSSIVDSALQATLGLGPKYSAQAKLPAIERLMPNCGDKPLAGSMDAVLGPGGAPVHLLIVGYDRKRAVFFRSAGINSPSWGDGVAASVSLAGAVHASTNAPINYFDGPAELPFQPDRFWDGAVSGCNNPAVAALVEALGLGKAAQDIHLLSLGTGNVVLPLAPAGAPASPLLSPHSDSSLLADLKKLAGAILDDPPDAATFVAHAVTGANAGLDPRLASRVVRMNPLISPVPDGNGGWTTPAGWSAAQFQYLCGIDVDAVAQNDVAYIDDYCQYWLQDRAPNQPIRMNGDTFKVEIGYGRFSEALVAWNLLLPRIA
jgi:hypothetical protein